MLRFETDDPIFIPSGSSVSPWPGYCVVEVPRQSLNKPIIAIVGGHYGAIPRTEVHGDWCVAFNEM